MNIQRKLASVQIVDSIRDIEGKDKIALAKINGWNAIVDKNEIKAGDKVIFFEQDALLPELPVFEVLRKNNFRVQKMKIGGVVSEGFALPIKTVYSQYEFSTKSLTNIIEELKLGEDLTEKLGVKHFEDRIHESRKFNAKSDCEAPFPNSVPKTDAIRIQNYQELLNMNSKYFLERYTVTEKLDGTSMTVIVGRPKEIGLRKFETSDVQVLVCGRNFIKKESKDCDYWRMVRDLHLDFTMKRYYEKTSFPIAFQGEIVGPGIQGNPYKLKERKFMIFSIYDIKYQKYIDFWETPKLGHEELGIFYSFFNHLDFVPFIGHLQLFPLYFNAFKPKGPDVEESGNETAEELVRQKMEDCETFFTLIKEGICKSGIKSALNKEITPEGIILTTTTGNSIKYIL